MECVNAIGFRLDTDTAESTQWNKIGEGDLEISADKLKYGDISIPYETISHAVLNENTRDGIYKTLYVDTDMDRFMFNLILGQDQVLELPFTVVNTEGGPLEIRNSPFLKIFIFSMALFVIFVIIGIYAK
jgi:hypothetical protein